MTRTTSSLTEAQYLRQLRDVFTARFGPRVDLTKIHGGPFQRVGVADLVLCFDGRFVALELKRPREQPTPIQQHYLARIAAAGGIAYVVDTDVPAAAVAELLHLEVTVRA